MLKFCVGSLLLFCCFSSIVKAQNTIKQVIVKKPLNFGSIKYAGSSGVFTINNNVLQPLGSNDMNYSSSADVSLAEIEINGDPNERVTLTFSDSRVDNTSTDVTVTGVAANNGANFVILDSTGKATVLVKGVIKINNINTSEIRGNITVWADYNTSNVKIKQTVPWVATIQLLKTTILSQLSFGKVIASPGGCYITVGVDNAPTTSNCAGYSGNITPMHIKLYGLILPHIPIIPQIPIYIVSRSGETLMMDSFTIEWHVHRELLVILGYTEITVGATLHIPPNISGGSYEGHFDVTWFL